MPSLFTSLSLATSLALHALFIQARWTIFRTDGSMPDGVRLIEVSVIASIVIGLALIASRPGDRVEIDVIALLVGIASAALFLWAARTVHRRTLTVAFSPDTPAMVLTAGPYRWVRHPFYVSYVLCYVHTLIASRSPWALLSLAWMAGIYVCAARYEERKFSSSPLAREYERYRQSTGSFLPWPGRRTVR